MASSRPYKLTVKSVLEEVQVAEDSIESRLNIPPILSPESTAAIIRRVLGERGFSRDVSGHMTRERGGVTVAINPDDGGISVRTSGSQEVSLEGEGNLPACSPCAERSRKMVRDGLDRALRQKADASQENLQREVTRRLEGALVELGCELERVGNQVTSSALKKKAQELGQISSIEQNTETGEMTIKVQVEM